MKHMKKAVLFAVICCMIFSGCGKEESTEAVNNVPETEAVVVAEESTEAETETEVVETETEEVSTESVKLAAGINLLTGEPMDEAIASQRPVAVMISNTADAMPQYGTTGADVIVESPVEGALTRIMAVYQDYANLPLIMSSRSARHYFVYLSNEFESIFVHYGQSIYTTEMLNNFDDLNGLDGDLADVTFFRDSSRKAPHNAYINGESIVAGIEKREFRTEHGSAYPGLFTFSGDEVTLDNGVDAKVVEPGYAVNKPWFVYNEETGLYDRYQYKAAHVDTNNGEQLAFKNIIFRVCDYSVFPDGKYLDVKTASYGGTGKYITNGKAVDITWVKPVEDGVVTYYDADGNELEINKGKTFVCIILNDATERMGIYASEADFEAARQ
ncbi:MAG: DUF3048 domain-containing protein [Lachnospiraceae bacterium]|nr:DUF3048 domain-containing protein [Lachnospiraceae bacterium]